MTEQFKKWWFCSLGVALANSLLLLGCTLLLGRPKWFTAPPAYGWSIYPPLSALPDSPASEADAIMSPYIQGMFMVVLQVAAMIGAVALVLWVVALLLKRQSGGQQKLFWIPLVLLLPLLYNVAGAYYRFSYQPAEQKAYDVQVGNEYRVYGQGMPLPPAPSEGETANPALDSIE